VEKDVLVVDLLGGEADLALLVAEATDRGDLGGCGRSSNDNRSGHRRRGGGRHEGRRVKVDSRRLLGLGGSHRLPLLDSLTLEDGALDSRCRRSLNLLGSSEDLSLHSRAGIANIVDELASHSIRAVAIGAVLLAHLGLVECRDISLDHHVGSTMGEGAL
jgi:hypothetical protein